MGEATNSIGHQQLTVSTTAVSLTVPTGKHPKHALITVQTAGVRWRGDGTAPTASVGNPLAADERLDLSDPMGNYSSLIANIQFIRSGGADATLDIEYIG